MARTLQAVYDELEIDLCLVRMRHIAARRRLREADTVGNRAEEAACRAQLDVLLDLLVELKDDDVPRRQTRSRPFPAPRRPT